MSYITSFRNGAEYAQLGSACNTSSDMLVDNSKFLRINDPIYNLLYTRMMHYPGKSSGLEEPIQTIERPEHIKTQKNTNKVEDYNASGIQGDIYSNEAGSGYRKAGSGCCGR
jgi:hypothetical protein